MDGSSTPPGERSRLPGISGTQVTRKALYSAFKKCNPVFLFHNPVLLIVELSAAFVTVFAIVGLATGHSAVFVTAVAIVMWCTLLLANFCEGYAHARNKAQADSLRRSLGEPFGKRLCGARIEHVPASKLRAGDVVLVEAGDLIPADGRVIEGIALVDESAITGESAPVIRESGGQLSAVTSGTRVISDQVKVRVTSSSGDSFLDRMLASVETVDRRRTPNETVFHFAIVIATVAFILVSVILTPVEVRAAQFAEASTLSRITIAFALMVCLIPTTVAALLSPVGLFGLERLMRCRVLTVNRTAVETAGDLDTLLIDKTGTLTLGNREAIEFVPLQGVTEHELAQAALLASVRDDTSEGRSTAELARRTLGAQVPDWGDGEPAFIPFSAYSRMSGVDLPGRSIRKGAAASIEKFVSELGGLVPNELHTHADRIARAGGTPLAVAEGSRVLGLIYLKDVVKPGLKDRLQRLRGQGIASVMITGDNPTTAAAIASEAGVDTFIPQATPADKLTFIKREQSLGRSIAMVGDGSNDAPALAQADISIAMNSGTTAAKEAAMMLDLDSDPTKLLEVVATGKQILATRLAVTLFAIAASVSTYCLIIPCLLQITHPHLQKWNFLSLAEPERAVLAGVMCNVLAVICLFPLALRGVDYRTAGRSTQWNGRSILYFICGLFFPIPFIWGLDRLLSALQLV